MNPVRQFVPELALFVTGFVFFAISHHAGESFAAGMAAAVVIVAGMMAGARSLGAIR